MTCEKCGSELNRKGLCEGCSGQAKGTKVEVGKFGLVVVVLFAILTAWYFVKYYQEEAEAVASGEAVKQINELNAFYDKEYDKTYRGMMNVNREYVIEPKDDVYIQVNLDNVGEILHVKLLMQQDMYNENPKDFTLMATELLNYFDRQGVTILDSLDVEKFEEDLFMTPKIYMEADREYQFLGLQGDTEADSVIIFTIKFK